VTKKKNVPFSGHLQERGKAWPNAVAILDKMIFHGSIVESDCGWFEDSIALCENRHKSLIIYGQR
jgi:hypothetical protein